MPLSFGPLFVVCVPLLALLVVVVGDCAADAADAIAEVVTRDDSPSRCVAEKVFFPVFIENADGVWETVAVGGGAVGELVVVVEIATK